MLTEPIVYVIDEDAATCNAIRRLASIMNLRCQVFDSGQDFLDLFDRSQCGCLVTELKAPGISGLQLQQRLSGEGSALPVIFVTAHATLPIAVRAMRAGAFHFLEKPFYEQELWDAIQDAINMDHERREALRRKEEFRDRLAMLTVKEEQVLRMIAQGKSSRVIAKDLDLSIRTIEVRRNALMRKLELGSTEELLRFAMSACNGHAPAAVHAAPLPHNGGGSRPSGHLVPASAHALKSPLARRGPSPAPFSPTCL